VWLLVGEVKDTKARRGIPSKSGGGCTEGAAPGRTQLIGGAQTWIQKKACKYATGSRKAQAVAGDSQTARSQERGERENS